jgi:hypothetical protein
LICDFFFIVKTTRIAAWHDALTWFMDRSHETSWQCYCIFDLLRSCEVSVALLW